MALSDAEFEEYLEPVINLWREKKNTAEMASVLKIKESDCAEVLTSWREAMIGMRDASEG